MELKLVFPNYAKKKILTKRGRLRPEIAKDIGLLISGFYKSEKLGVISHEVASIIQDPNVPMKIEVRDIGDDECFLC